MKRFWKLEKPQAVLDAAKAQKGLHIVLELLIFVAVFYIGAIGQNILVVPGMIVLFVIDPEFRGLFTSFGSLSVKDIQGIYDKITTIDSIMVLTLLVTVATTVIAMLFCKLLQSRKMNTLGFRKKGFVAEYIVGWVVGFVLFSAAVLICVLTGSLTFEGFAPTFSIGTFLMFTIGFIVQGMSEEVLCRGYFLTSVGRRYSMLIAIIANSVFFAALHLTNSGISVLAFINLALFGVFASVYFIKRDNIWGICAVHSVWNLAQGNVYDIRVSGMKLSCSVFSTEIVEGKELINGGAFGLEGGLAVTIVLVVGTVILLFMKGKKTEEVQVQ